MDTDAGSDDLVAIAFLLSRPDIHVEAITIENGMAQDPLAAAALANPAVVTFRPKAIDISDHPGEEGRTVELRGKNQRANAQVAVDADSLRFRDVFLTALGVR